jgi:ADP-ribosylglycohydrolase
MKNSNFKYGLIYGLCVGDALGSRYEFLQNDESKIKVQEDLKNNFLPILGEGFFNNEKGQITDDAEMALALLHSLSKKKTYKRSDVARKYIKWFQTNPVDIGQTIRKSISTRKIAKGKHDMINNSKEMNMSSLSNGTLMRIAPIALLYPKHSIAQLKKITSKECELTHPSKIIKDAVWIYIYAIILILDKTPKKTIYEKLLKEVETPKVYTVLLDCIKRPEPTAINDNTFDLTDSIKFQGYFGIALQNCFYEFFEGKSFYDSMVNIVKRGGDVDTNCAIAGALLGAYYGKDKIPTEWIKTIKEYHGERSKLYSTNDLEKLVDTLV